MKSLLLLGFVSLLLCSYVSGFVYCDSFYGLGACAAPWTNQIGYLYKSYKTGLWQHKQTLSLGCALGLGSFTAMNPWPCAVIIT